MRPAVHAGDPRSRSPVSIGFSRRHRLFGDQQTLPGTAGFRRQRSVLASCATLWMVWVGLSGNAPALGRPSLFRGGGGGGEPGWVSILASAPTARIHSVFFARSALSSC